MRTGVRWRGAILGLAAACALACQLGCQRQPPAPRGLVFISLDTVRYDHLSLYGYPRETSPTLDSLAARAIVFDHAFSQQPNTSPSHASMFTGLYPHVHGNELNAVPLAPDKKTLAQILRQRGFRTAGFVSGVTMQDEYSGLGRGFEVYDDKLEEQMRRSGKAATGGALSWLRSLRPAERFFLFVHLYDAHGPYLPPAHYRRMFAAADHGPELPRIPVYQQLVRAGQPLRHLSEYADRYDAMIRFEDDLVWRLLQQIDLATTIVVVLADHGETLGERYQALDHGAQLYDEQVRIPLLISVPGMKPRRVGQFVETVDLLPTLLQLLAVPPPPGIHPQGSSLVPLAAGKTEPLRSFVFASARVEPSWFADRGYQLDPKRQLLSVRSRRWKLIFYPGLQKDYLELYDLQTDPGETRDVSAQQPRIREGLLEVLKRWRGGQAGPAQEMNLPPGLREKLKALGYLGN